MKKFTLLILIFLLSTTSIFAADPPDQFYKEQALKRLSLMSFADDAESQTDYDLNWNNRTSGIFSFFPMAHAYKEGDPCLVLGFQSTYKNGVCRLSLAPDAKQYKKSCHNGQYACNPQVFGQYKDKPFCISASLGNELSKYCSYQSISSIAKDESLKDYSKKTQEILKKIKKTRPQDFKFEMVLKVTDDNSFNKAFSALFKAPHTLDKSRNYTSKLCSSIHSSTSSKNFNLDLASCKNQLEILSSTKVEEVEKLVTKDIKKKSPKTVVTLEPVISADIDLDINEPKRECAVVIEKSKIDVNINDITTITDNLEAKSYMRCVNELSSRKDLPSEYHGDYIHKINRTPLFAKQCWKIDNYGEKEIVYSFVSDEGFKMLKFPVYKEMNMVQGNNVLKFYSKNKPYYISQYFNIGEYFDSIPADQLAMLVKDRDFMPEDTPAAIVRDRIAPYDKLLKKYNKGKRIELTSPEENGFAIKTAKSCLNERLEDYTRIIMERTYRHLIPDAAQINQDIKLLDKSALQLKYRKTANEIQSILKEKLFPKSSSCHEVINDKTFDKLFKKAYSSQLENYTTYRGYFLD